MRKLIAILVLMILMGCAGVQYRWNETSGKAGEGRCHVVMPDGKLGVIVPSEKCGR